MCCTFSGKTSAPFTKTGIQLNAHTVWEVLEAVAGQVTETSFWYLSTRLITITPVSKLPGV